MHPGEKALAIRNMRGWTGNATAKKAGMHRANLMRFERDGEGLGTKTVAKLAAALGTTVSDLLDPTPPLKVLPLPASVETTPIREQDDEDDFDPRVEVRLPVYDVEVSGGPGALIPEFVETREYLTFRRSWLKKVAAREDEIKIVNVIGDSMEPRLWEGDKLAIHTGKRKVRSGRVFAIAYNNEARVKRLYLLADGRLRIVSDNPNKTDHPDEFIEGEELNRITIIGQAVHRMGSGGL